MEDIRAPPVQIIGALFLCIKILSSFSSQFPYFMRNIRANERLLREITSADGCHYDMVAWQL